MSLIRIEDVTFRRDDRTILSNVNLSVDRGDFVAITGPNGGGKTTMLRLILGLLTPTTGSITFANEGGRKPSIGYLPQKNSVDSQFPISVHEVVSSGLLAQKNLSKAEKEQMVNEILELIELKDYSRQSIGRLSGGQLQRALFGRAIISRPEILVLDEPLSYLDNHFEERLYHIIEELSERTTILLVSHQMSRISRMANRHLLIDHTVEECHTPHCHNQRDI
ncbi:MAG: ABC transporter ATP-binding protein [Bacteroidales bacterium]|nr:ABC transporter ATP-binding protein [Bacteroidales bacterium]